MKEHPQNSVLDPLLFVMYTKKLNQNEVGHVKYVWSDRKTGLALDIRVEKYQMEFNPEECPTIHTKDAGMHTISGGEIERCEGEKKDLGCLFRDLIEKKQVRQMVEKA